MNSNNPDHVVELLQKGFRITLGATTSLVESLQDSQKRDENLTKLRLEWSQLSEEWAEKGAETEQEARRFVDSMLANRDASTTGSSASSATASATPAAPPDIQEDIQELTAQIAAMRIELENLRNSNSSSL